MAKKAAVLWTGGKDSALALHEANLLGYEIKSLVTFAPAKPEFLAHPLGFMKYQAEALQLPHFTLEVNEPFKEEYGKAILSLKRQGIDTIITGDIAEVEGYPNWIRECSEGSGLEVLTPLWGFDRDELMDRLLAGKFRIIFSCVKKPWFTEAWLGRELDKAALEQLRALKVDICGEQGEYHTLALDGPPFKKSIQIQAYLKWAKDSLLYLTIQKVILQKKS